MMVAEATAAIGAAGSDYVEIRRLALEASRALSPAAIRAGRPPPPPPPPPGR
jgi:hypothetical protein